MISPAAEPQTLNAEEKAKKTSTSRGERIFDWLTYGGIGFVGVFAAGVPIGYWGKYGGGARYFKNTAQYLERLGLSAKAAEDFAMTSTLMIPGNLALLPIKIMENCKPVMVECLNKLTGDPTAAISVEDEPKQTWGSLIKSRVAAWLAVFTGFRGAAAVVGGEKFAAFENKFAEYIVCNPLGKPTHLPGLTKIAENETKLFRYGKIAALDFFATAAATILLYVGSRFFARKNEHWHTKQAHEPSEEQSAEPVLPTPSRPFADKFTPRGNALFTETVANGKAAGTPLGISA